MLIFTITLLQGHSYISVGLLNNLMVGSWFSAFGATDIENVCGVNVLLQNDNQTEVKCTFSVIMPSGLQNQNAECVNTSRLRICVTDLLH